MRTLISMGYFSRIVLLFLLCPCRKRQNMRPGTDYETAIISNGVNCVHALQPPRQNNNEVHDRIRGESVKIETLTTYQNDDALLKSNLDICVPTSTYCSIAKENFKRKGMYKLHRERLVVSATPKRNLYTIFSDLLENGKVSGSGESYSSHATGEAMQNSFHTSMKPGSGLFISNCLLSIAYAKSSLNNNVVTIFSDETSAAQCEEVISRKKLTNIFLSVMNVQNIQSNQMLGESFILNSGFDVVVVSEIGKLSEGLLPHEVEQLLSKALDISAQTIIILDIQEHEQLHFFKSSWQTPVNLMKNVCALKPNYLNCSSKVLEGFGYTWKPITFDIEIAKNAANKSEAEARSKNVGISVQFLLSINMTRASRDAVFQMLIKSKMDISNYFNLHVRGDKVIEILKENRVKDSVLRTPKLQASPKYQLDEFSSSLSSSPSYSKTETNNENPLEIKRQDRRVLLNNVLKRIGRLSHSEERFEAQWNREESDDFQTIHADVLNQETSLGQRTENKSFDIIDGRPVEEEKRLTAGYSYLNRNVKGKEATAWTKLSEKQRIYISDKVQELDKMKNKIKESKFTSESPKTLKQKSNQRRRINHRRWTDSNTNSAKQKFQIFQDLNSMEEEAPTINRKYKTDKISLLSALKFNENKNVTKGNHLDDTSAKGRQGRRLLMMPDIDSTGKVQSGDLRTKYEVFKQRMGAFKYNDRAQSIVSSKAATESSQILLDSARYRAPQEATKEELYGGLRDIILPRLDSFLQGKQVMSALISGECPFAMLGAKSVRLYPTLNIITLNNEPTSKCPDDLRSFLDNAFHSQENLGPDIVYQMTFTPQLFDFQVVSSNVFSWLLQMGTDFQHFLAHILSLSKVTFVEVPEWGRLVSALSLFGHDALIQSTGFQDYLRQIHGFQSSQIEYFEVQDISTPSWKSLKGTHIYMIKMSSIQRKVLMSCNSQSQQALTFHYRKSESQDFNVSQLSSQPFPELGLNLKLLLSLQKNPHHRKKLFASYLRLNKYTDMCSSKLYWRQGKLRHQQEDSSDIGEGHSVKELTNMLNRDMHQSQFSFMDINSPDRNVGAGLAQTHPNSTFILAHTTSSNVAKSLQQIKQLNLTNVIPLDLPMTGQFTSHFLKSPDILRYQYFDFVYLLQSLQSQDYTDVRSAIGQILSSGLTTFLTMPSSQIISLAATTLYPGIFTENSYTITDTVPLFENAEQILLMQCANADVNIKLHTTLQPAVSSDLDGHLFWYPWRLLAVRIMELKLKVDHHFMFELDGHQRKYFQHVERKEISIQPSVYLLREEDDYRINYGNVNAISLIALLRMGLPPSMKEEFYDQFIQLPLYEDMAPWNIVLRGGKLDYIDQDTRDKTFDKLVPMAYQIMSVLMNYKRTVADFGHCKAASRTAYNIQYIASCVMNDFVGPCPDSRFPVPCGDKSCKSSYVECLRALNKKMTNSNGSEGQQRQTSNDRFKEYPATNIWSFDGKKSKYT